MRAETSFADSASSLAHASISIPSHMFLFGGTDSRLKLAVGCATATLAVLLAWHMYWRHGMASEGASSISCACAGAKLTSSISRSTKY
jgi:hypothetical protein